MRMGSIFIILDKLQNIEFSLNVNFFLNDKIQQPFPIHYKTFLNFIAPNFVHIVSSEKIKFITVLINVDIQRYNIPLNSVHHNGRS